MHSSFCFAHVLHLQDFKRDDAIANSRAIMLCALGVYVVVSMVS